MNLSNLFACRGLGREEIETGCPAEDGTLRWEKRTVRARVSAGPINNNMRLWGILRRGFPALRAHLDQATYRWESWPEKDLRWLEIEFPSARTDPRGPVFDSLTIYSDGRTRQGQHVRVDSDGPFGAMRLALPNAEGEP